MLNVLALFVLSIAVADGAYAAGYAIRAIAQVPNGAAATGAPQLNLSTYVGTGERLVMSRAMQVDESGAVYLNFDRIGQTGWWEVPADEVFEMDQGRKPQSAEELGEWRKERFDKDRPATEPAKREAWENYRAGTRRIHPGIAPVEARRPLSVKINADGQVLSISESVLNPAQSGLVEGTTISAEDLAWFKESVRLVELAHKREKVEWIDAGKKKSVERNAEFETGLKLGEDKGGNTVYLMTIVMPFLRPHRHGTSDSLARVYVISKDKKVIQVRPAYPTIRMHSTTRDLYELHKGAYEGLMPALDDPQNWPLVVRVWGTP